MIAPGSWGPAGLDPRPIMLRDLRAAARRASTFRRRAGFAILVLIVVGAVLYTSFGRAGSAGSYASARMLATLPPLVGCAVVWCEYVGLAMMSTVLIGGPIDEERRSRALPVLLATPLTGTQLALGYVGSRLAELCLLALIPLPAVLALRVFGDIPIRPFLTALALCAATAFLGAGATLHAARFGAPARSAAGAGTCTLLAVSLVLGYAIEQVSIHAGMALSPTVESALYGPRIITLLTREILGAPPASGAVGAALIHAAVLALVGVLLVSHACLTIRRGALRSLRASDLPRPAPRARAGRRPVEFGARPVFWREVRRPLPARRSHVVTSLLIAGAALGVAYVRLGFDDAALHGVVAVIGAVIAFVSAAGQGVHSISSERDARTWDTLLTLPIRPGPLLLHKSVGAVRAAWPVAAIAGAHFILAIVFGRWNLAYSLAGLALLLVTISASWAVVGVAAGLWHASARRAHAGVVGLMAGVYLLLPLLLLIVELSEIVPGRAIDALQRAVAIVNAPFVSCAAVGAAYPEEHFVPFWTGSVSAMWLACVACGAIHLAGAGVVLAVSGAGFNRRCGRPS